MAKKKESVATTCANYDVMSARWELMNTLLGGTEAMREVGELYLPKHSEEDSNDYFNRLMTTTLLNKTSETLEHLTGTVFDDVVKMKEEGRPAWGEDFEKDVDGAGTTLHAFCRNWFMSGVAKGFSHVLVDYPEGSPETTETGQPYTLADQQKENRRPYWCHIPAENLIFAYSKVIDGKEKLLHVRIVEEETYMDGFAEATSVFIRVLEPGYWALYQKGARKDEWTKVGEGTTTLDFIPLVTFYAGRKSGLLLAKPPLQDLAYLNVRHWQSSSDQNNVLTVARFPMLAVSGNLAEDENGIQLKVGPRQWLHTPDPAGKFYYVEHQGNAIKAGQEDLTALEAMMNTFGAQFMVKQPGTQTATERALDSAEAISPLEAMAQDFKACADLALRYTANWLGEEEGGEALVKTDLSATIAADAPALTALGTARTNRDLSGETYLNELKRRNILDESVDAEEEKKKVAEETSALVDAGLMPDPSMPPAEEDDEDMMEDDEEEGAPPAKKPPFA